MKALLFFGALAVSALAQTPRAAPHTAGVAACATCHAAEAKGLAGAAMTRALEPVDRCEILRSHPRLTFQEGIYRFTIERKGEQSLYTVTDGSSSVTAPIRWAFGLGEAGQTYVLERNGRMVESRVSFYTAINGLDITVGAQGLKPSSVEEAVGRLMFDSEAKLCFGCHATDYTPAEGAHAAAFAPGVQCERCHAGSGPHQTAVAAGDANRAKMPSLAKMNTEETSDFCGQCHRTWQEIALGGPSGVNNVRFQPYRLTNSRCYDTADQRIRCTACHDPHGPLVRAAAYYDSKCQSCHAPGAKARAKACPVAKSSCVTCHMPKVELPGGHKKFTDHQIRIARANEPYPN